MTPALVGRAALVTAFALAVFGALAAALGSRRRDPRLLESARTSAYALLALVSIAVTAMLVAILSNDFSVRYVAENSSRATPTFFKVLSLWAADSGSLLVWTLLVVVFTAALAAAFGRRSEPLAGPALAVLFCTAAFYLMLVVGPAQPFAAGLPVPSDGRGPPALLQNHPLMAAHPPLLYLGFVGLTIPFAFAISALMAGRTDAHWIALSRRWTVVAWTALTGGLVLGALWSYGVLGWGGYWAWDPVENAALLPWLASTALLHGMRVQRTAGRLATGNAGLAIGAYALTVLGTFLTRGDLLLSVHTFADSAMGPMYLGFLALVLVGGFGLLALRAAPSGTREMPAAGARTAGVFVGNVLLLVVAAIVLVGTMYPLLAEAAGGAPVSVGAPYYVHAAGPVLLGVLFAMGLVPALGRRRSTVRETLASLRGPVAVSAAVILVPAIAGVRDATALAAVGIATFTGASALTNLRPARYRDVSRPREGARHAGWVAHLGVAVAAIGIVTSTAFRHQVEVTASSVPLVREGIGVRLEGSRRIVEPRRTVEIVRLAVTYDGDIVGLAPSINEYGADAVGSPSIRLGLPWNGFTDVYASVLSISPAGTSARVRVLTIPGASAIWIGGALAVLGGLLSATNVVGRRRRPGAQTDEGPTPAHVVERVA